MALNSYGLEDDNPTDVTPWLSGADTLVPNDPQAQVTPGQGAIWGQDPSTQPGPAPNNAVPQGGAGSAAQGQGAGVNTPFTQDMGTTGTPFTWFGADPSNNLDQRGTITSSGPTSYEELMRGVNTAANPQARALAQDALSRQLQSDLEGDGHTVKWVNGQLNVDGRVYELGGSAGGDGPTFEDPKAAKPSEGSAPTGGAPRGGNLTDPSYVDQFLSYWGQQPGVNPSVRNDPGYWREKILSGELGPDESYIIQRMMTPEGAPMGSGGLDLSGLLGAGAGTPVRASPFASGGGTLPDWLTNPEGDPDLAAIAEQIPGFEEIYNRLTQIDPNEEATAALVYKILNDPEALSEQDVEMLKAANAEEALVAGQANDEDLKRFGYQADLDSSPWLAGQRSTNAAATRSAIISSNRGVDIAAANTRQANRQASANVGQTWTEYRQGKSVQAISAAMEGAATKGNIEQAAKQLGMNKAQLSIAYIGQSLNYDLNLQALQKRSEEFQSTLALQIAQLKQNDEQFAANFGLALQRFQEDKDQNAWARSQAATE